MLTIVVYRVDNAKNVQLSINATDNVNILVSHDLFANGEKTTISFRKEQTPKE